jgi:hypothetical protein
MMFDVPPGFDSPTTQRGWMGTTASIREYVQDELITGDYLSLRDGAPLSRSLFDPVDLTLPITSPEDRFGLEVEKKKLISAQLRMVSEIAALVDKRILGT